MVFAILAKLWHLLIKSLSTKTYLKKKDIIHATILVTMMDVVTEALIVHTKIPPNTYHFLCVLPLYC